LARPLPAPQHRLDRDLEILTAIGEGRPLSQRALAERLGVALGLTNLLIKRLAKTGYIKVVQFPRKPAAQKRFRYLLTAKGITEKSRLTYEHAAYAVHVYGRARRFLREALAHLDGARRVALYGTGEAAELAYLTLKELRLEPMGVYWREGGGKFLGLPVQPIEDLIGQPFDALIVATFERPESHVESLARLGLPADKLFGLRPPVAARPAGEG